VAMGIIELQDVSVQFDDVLALDRSNVSIQEGDLCSIIGPNGAGKTTALRVMAGLLEPTRGIVLFHGQAISGSESFRLRRVSTLVFQKPVVFSTSVFKNVAYGLRVRGIGEDEIRKRVRQALELVEMQDLSDRFARALSGGEQRRVCLAMGMVTNPQLFLLDEPTTYLDTENREIVERVLRKLNEDQGMTIVISTHNMLQAENLSHRAIILQNGRVEQTGMAHEILRQKLEHLVLEDTTSNLFRGVAEESGHKTSGRRIVRVSIGENVSFEAISDRSGNVTVHIPPEDIMVSHQPILSSARNTMRGIISEIQQEDAVAFLTVNVGVPLRVQITNNSLDSLQISVGQEVVVTFKASSVSIY
jgi:tungstate transport system ATP-binding protein